MAYVVVARFEVKPDWLERLLPLADQHAHNSRTGEPGCLAFDVCQDPEAPTRLLFYEVYMDEAAYRAHRETASYAWFRQVIEQAMVPGPDGAVFRERLVLERRDFLPADAPVAVPRD